MDISTHTTSVNPYDPEDGAPAVEAPGQDQKDFSNDPQYVLSSRGCVQVTRICVHLTLPAWSIIEIIVFSLQDCQNPKPNYTLWVKGVKKEGLWDFFISSWKMHSCLILVSESQTSVMYQSCSFCSPLSTPASSSLFEPLVSHTLYSFPGVSLVLFSPLGYSAEFPS